MNLSEAKKLLNANGFKCIKESAARVRQWSTIPEFNEIGKAIQILDSALSNYKMGKRDSYEFSRGNYFINQYEEAKQLISDDDEHITQRDLQLIKIFETEGYLEACDEGDLRLIGLSKDEIAKLKNDKIANDHNITKTFNVDDLDIAETILDDKTYSKYIKYKKESSGKITLFGPESLVNKAIDDMVEFGCNISD